MSTTPTPTPTYYVEYPEDTSTAVVETTPVAVVVLDSNKAITAFYGSVVGILVILLSGLGIAKLRMGKDIVGEYVYSDSLEVYIILGIIGVYFSIMFINELTKNTDSNENDVKLKESRMDIELIGNVLFLCIFMFLFSKFGQKFNIEYPMAWTLSTFAWGIGIIVMTYLTNQNFTDLQYSDSKLPVVMVSLIVPGILALGYFTNRKIFNFPKGIYYAITIICAIFFILALLGPLKLNESKQTLGAGLIIFIYSLFIGSFWNQIESEFHRMFLISVGILFVTSFVLIGLKKPETEYSFNVDYDNIWSNLDNYSVTPVVRNVTDIDWKSTNDVKINLLVDLRELNNTTETLISCGDDWRLVYDKPSESIVYTLGNDSVSLPLQDNVVTINIPSIDLDNCEQSCKDACGNVICESECVRLKCKPNRRSNEDTLQVMPLTINVYSKKNGELNSGSITIYNDTSANNVVGSLFIENIKPPGDWSDTITVNRPGVVRNVIVAQAKEKSFNDLPFMYRLVIIMLLSSILISLLGYFVHPRVREYLGIPGGSAWAGNLYNRVFNS